MTVTMMMTVMRRMMQVGKHCLISWQLRELDSCSPESLSPALLESDTLRLEGRLDLFRSVLDPDPEAEAMLIFVSSNTS